MDVPSAHAYSGEPVAKFHIVDMTPSVASPNANFPRGVRAPWADVVAGAEAADAQHADRTDSHRPVHAGHADAVVAHGADRAGDVQTVVTNRVGKEAGPGGVGRIGRGDGRIGIVAVSVIGVADGAAGT